jgi:hypothetical protein
VKRLFQGEEVENDGGFQKLTCQVGLWGGQALLKVGNRLSLAFVGVAFLLYPRVSRLQPCSMVCCMYQKRVGRSLTFSMRMT